MQISGLQSPSTMREATDGAPRYPVQSVDAALRLLALVHRMESVSASAAAREIGVAPSTAHRLFAMLEQYGLVARDPATKAYRIGPWLVELGLAELTALDIREQARPHLRELVASVGETAHLVGLYGSEAVFLDCVECSAALRATSRIGQRLPAHCTAAGKAQLALLSAERLTSLYPSEHLAGLTANSMRSRVALFRDLERIRKAGYATNRRESETDLHAIAAAITDQSGAVRGAITVAGPPDRMKASRLREIAPVVQQTALDIGVEVSAGQPTESHSGE
jgi:DNA-binding IclR family transcriptional regulator